MRRFLALTMGLVLTLTLASPATAQGVDDYAPNYAAVLGFTEGQPVTRAQAARLVATAIDSSLGVRWRDDSVHKNYCTLHNADGDVETDWCDLKSAGAFPAGWHGVMTRENKVWGFTPDLNATLTRADLALVLFNLVGFTNEHNGNASGTDAWRQGADSPHAEADMLDYGPFVEGPYTRAPGNIFADYNYVNWEINAAILQAVQPGRRFMEPCGLSEPSQNQPYPTLTLNFCQDLDTTVYEASLSLQRWYAANLQYHPFPYTSGAPFRQVPHHMWHRYWTTHEDDYLSANAHNLPGATYSQLPWSNVQPEGGLAGNGASNDIADGWVTGPASYWTNYGFMDVDVYFDGWGGSEENHTLGWGGSGGSTEIEHGWLLVPAP